jgi:hypothetical protein
MVNSIKGELQQLLVEKALVQGSSSPTVTQKPKSGSERLASALATNLAGDSGMIGDKSRKYQDTGIPPATQSTRLGRGASTYNVRSDSPSSIQAYNSLTASLNTGVIKWLDSRGTALTMNLKSGESFKSDRYNVDPPSKQSPTTFLKVTAYEDA